MAYFIDSTTYSKAKDYPQRHGYQLRGALPTSIVVHSTSNSKKNTSFASEATYLYESANVSAHYLIGKDGRIVEFLDPRAYQAWHAGGQQRDGTWTAQPAYANPKSIGVELHHSVGDPPYPTAQLDALGWLLKRLAGQFLIAPTSIETHGQIALPGPYSRKHDPDGWPHADFIRWRDALFTVRLRYAVRHTQAIFESPTPDGKVALNDTARIIEGAIVELDEARADGWGHLANAIGFVPLGVLTRLP